VRKSSAADDCLALILPKLPPLLPPTSSGVYGGVRRLCAGSRLVLFAGMGMEVTARGSARDSKEDESSLEVLSGVDG